MADGERTVSPKECSLAYDEQQQSTYETDSSLAYSKWNVVDRSKHALEKIAFLSDYTTQEVVKITGTITVSF